MIRRTLLGLATLLVLVLVGCGGGEPAASGGGESRQLQTAMGPVEVPADPQRVVVLDNGELDVALSLGTTPVGYATADGAVNAVQPYLEDRLADAERVGTNLEPALEKITALRPDVILGTKVRVGAIYDRLSAIAPTVLGETPAAWRDNLRLHGDALGRGEAARRFLRDFDARGAALGRRLGDPGATSAAVVRFLPGEIRLYTPASFSGSILRDTVGVRLPPDAEAETSDIDVKLSLETLDRADADVLFVSTYGDPDATDRDRAAGLRTWRSLPAVRAGRVHRVDDDVWMLGIGPTGARMVLDDLERLLPE